MKSIRIECDVSLSKKLRKVIDVDGVSISLNCDNLKNGVGKGVLSINSDVINDDVLDKSETCIILTPTSIEDNTAPSTSVGNLFTSQLSDKEPNKVVEKIAETNPPKNVQELKERTKKRVKTPKELNVVNNPNFIKFVSSFEELMREVKKAQTKKIEDIDLSTITDIRQRALMEERLNKEEGLDVPAYIVNKKYGVLSVNDIKLDLNLNSPLNLANIPAKRIDSSNELKKLIKDGIVEFISPEEADRLLNSLDGEESTAPVYNNHKEALEAAGSLEENDVNENETTETENIINLTGIPQKKAATSNNNRITQHRPQSNPDKKPDFKPITRIE